MRIRLLVLAIALLVVLSVAASAQPLTAISKLTITFTPVLVQETVEEGYEEGKVMYSPTIRFRMAYRVTTE